jgi:hypothetical protein
MSPPPQQPPARRWRIPRWLWFLGIAFALLVMAAVMFLIPFRRVEHQVDCVTGSHRRHTLWAGVIESNGSVRVSELERQLTTRGVPWTRAWRRTGGMEGFNVFGVQTLCAIGAERLPIGIGEREPGFDAFVASATDAELRAFLNVMESGSDAEQRVALDAAAITGLERPRPASGSP